ncbi:hypothetical protein BB561_002168 [Smittium simulii]|uniref:Uncharacterized protein n=1 Tax=Smittium simulii TaxID=133385 RepID=A0A2T9YRD8_9FUNG|nr:hypothetical protein BB561_002168 [Smittium simulii]
MYYKNFSISKNASNSIRSKYSSRLMLLASTNRRFSESHKIGYMLNDLNSISFATTINSKLASKKLTIVQKQIKRRIYTSLENNTEFVDIQNIRKFKLDFIFYKKFIILVEILSKLKTSASYFNMDVKDSQIKPIAISEYSKWPGSNIESHNTFLQTFYILLNLNIKENTVLYRYSDNSLFELASAKEFSEVFSNYFSTTSISDNFKVNDFLFTSYIEYIQHNNLVVNLAKDNKWVTLFIEILKKLKEEQCLFYAIRVLSSVSYEIQNCSHFIQILEIIEQKITIKDTSQSLQETRASPTVNNNDKIRSFLINLSENPTFIDFLGNNKFCKIYAELVVIISTNSFVFPYRKIISLYNTSSLTLSKKKIAQNLEKFMSQVLYYSYQSNKRYFEKLFVFWTPLICATLGKTTMYELVNPRPTPYKSAKTPIPLSQLYDQIYFIKHFHRKHIIYFYYLSFGQEINTYKLQTMIETMTILHKPPKAIVLFYLLTKKAGKKITIEGLKIFRKNFIFGSQSERNIMKLLEFNSNNTEMHIQDSASNKYDNITKTNTVYPGHAILFEILNSFRLYDHEKYLFQILFSHMIKYNPGVVMFYFRNFLSENISANINYSFIYRIKNIIGLISNLKSLGTNGIPLNTKIDCFSRPLSVLGIEKLKNDVLVSIQSKNSFLMNSSIQRMFLNKFMEHRSYYCAHYFCINLLKRNEIKQLILGLMYISNKGISSNPKIILNIFECYAYSIQPAILLYFFKSLMQLSLEKSNFIMDNFLFQEMSSILLMCFGISDVVTITELNELWLLITQFSQFLTHKAERILNTNVLGGNNGITNSNADSIPNYNIIPNYNPNKKVCSSYIEALVAKRRIYDATYMALFYLPQKFSYRCPATNFILILNNVSNLDSKDQYEPADVNLFSHLLNHWMSSNPDNVTKFLENNKRMLSIGSQTFIQKYLNNRLIDTGYN